MSLRYIKEAVKEKKGIHNFDVLGSLLLGVFLGTLVLVLDQGQSWGWSSTKSIVSYGITAVSFIFFILVERHTQEPVVDLKFFKNWVFTSSIINSFISFMGLIGGIFLIPVFAQQLLGYSVTKAGYIFIPMALAIMIASQVGARLVKRFPTNLVISFGMALAAFGMFLFANIDIKWGFFDMALRLFVMAFGIGMGLAPLTRSATSTIPIHEVGIASSILALARNIAGAFGTAIFATILDNSVSSHLLSIQQHSVLNSQDPVVIQQYMSLISVKATIAAYATVFQVSVFILLFGAFTALFIRTSNQTVTQAPEHTNEPIEI
jgi:predicted MFS family arabinose efflux permease